MTLDAAYASFQEHEIGSLEVGKKADLVVFDRDFVGCENEEICDGSEILEAKVKAVVIDGHVVWGELPRLDVWKVICELSGKLTSHARGFLVRLGCPFLWWSLTRYWSIVIWISWYHIRWVLGMYNEVRLFGRRIFRRIDDSVNRRNQWHYSSRHASPRLRAH